MDGILFLYACFISSKKMFTKSQYSNIRSFARFGTYLLNLKIVKHTLGGVLLSRPATLLKETLFHWCFSRFLILWMVPTHHTTNRTTHHKLFLNQCPTNVPLFQCFPVLGSNCYKTAEKDKGKSKAEKVTGWFVRRITDIRFYS